jgi:hypothetical protein
MDERHVLEELRNICVNEPLWPGSTISHETANECVKRGWARRDDQGNFVSTEDGQRIQSRVDNDG